MQAQFNGLQKYIDSLKELQSVLPDK